MKMKWYGGILAVSALPLLGGCLYVSADVSKEIKAEAACPFEENVTYEGTMTADMQEPTAMGRFRFAQDRHIGAGCRLRQAEDVTDAGDWPAAYIVLSAGADLDEQTSLRWMQMLNALPGFYQAALVTRRPDGAVEVREDCYGSSFPALGRSGETDCFIDEVADLKLLLAGKDRMRVTYTFRPLR